MHIQPKLAFAVLGVLCLAPFVHAQGSQADRAPEAAGGAYSANPGPMDDGGSWGQPDQDGGARGAWNDGGDRGNGNRGGAWNRGGRGDWNRGPNRGMHGHRGGPDMMLARMVRNPSFRDKLGITADQAAKIQQQSSDFRKAQIRSRADLEVKRLELQDLMSGDTPDRAAINKKLEDISAARLTSEKTSVDFRLTARNWLTPEQRQKLEQMRQQFSQRGFGQGPGRGGNGNRGPRGPRGQGQPGGAPPAPAAAPSSN